MHFNGISHNAQGDGAQMGHAEDEESVLLFDDFLRHFQDCSSALIEAFHQPRSLGVAFRKEQFVFSFRGSTCHKCCIAIVDENAGQSFGVEFDKPRAILSSTHADIWQHGHHRL